MTPIGKEDENDSTRLQNAVDLTDLREWIGKVLEDVTRDDEVLARVSERSESIDVEVGNDVGLGKGRACLDVGEECPILLGLPAIHEQHGDAGVRQRHRMITGTELNARAVEKTREQPSR
jgi:hypothetical protein